jgi:N-acylneuraminate cytidylyltransferase
MYRMDAIYSFQIDEPSDFELVEHLMSRRLTSASGNPLFGRVKLLVLDFDGVMTDNRVLVNEHGEEAVFCDRSDGWGLAQLRNAGVEICILSTETNAVVAARSRKLGLQCLQACDDKLGQLQRLAGERGLRPTEIAYMGNDENDIGCMEWVGIPIAVADGIPIVRERAKFVTSHYGGRGAVREVADRILAELATQSSELALTRS